MTKQAAPSTQLSAALPIETKGLSVLSQHSARYFLLLERTGQPCDQ